jgi:hypothetical protein
VGSVLITSGSTVLVALIGIVGILLTQSRADGRQERIAAADREFERASEVGDKRREAAVEFLAAVWDTARRSRDVLPDGSDYSDLPTEMSSQIDKTSAKVAVLGGPATRDAAVAMMKTLVDFVGDFSQERWDALDKAEDVLVAAVNDEPVQVYRESRPSLDSFGTPVKMPAEPPANAVPAQPPVDRERKLQAE